jgi:hypothetical protein
MSVKRKSVLTFYFSTSVDDTISSCTFYGRDVEMHYSVFKRKRGHLREASFYCRTQTCFISVFWVEYIGRGDIAQLAAACCKINYDTAGALANLEFKNL